MFNPLVLCLLFGALFQVAYSECMDCGFFHGSYCDKSLNECVYRKGPITTGCTSECAADPKCRCKNLITLQTECICRLH
ncbi:hypothetical protein AAVH_21189 [Aphelenchoides avenae]|nr:hypothetical protein AAVH_21189 [Aphelenchus avenae]